MEQNFTLGLHPSTPEAVSQASLYTVGSHKRQIVYNNSDNLLSFQKPVRNLDNTYAIEESEVNIVTRYADIPISGFLSLKMHTNSAILHVSLCSLLAVAGK